MFSLKNLVVALALVPMAYSAADAQSPKKTGPIRPAAGGITPPKTGGITPPKTGGISPAPTMDLPAAPGALTEAEVVDMLRSIDPDVKRVRYFGIDSYEVKISRPKGHIFVLVTIEKDGIFLDAVLSRAIREERLSHNVMVDLLAANTKTQPNFFVLDRKSDGSVQLRMTRGLPRSFSAAYLRTALDMIADDCLVTLPLWRDLN